MKKNPFIELLGISGVVYWVSSACSYSAESSYIKSMIEVLPASESLKSKVASEIPPSAIPNFFQTTPKNYVKKTTPLLRDWSIYIDSIGKKIEVRDPSFHDTDNPIGPLNYYPVVRPGEKNFVAVIKTIGGHPNVLNPTRGFVYGPIPPLRKMTVEQADALWGMRLNDTKNLVPGNEQRREYKLVSYNSKNVKKEFVIRCKFFNNTLNEYKIVGPEVDEKCPYDIIDDRYVMFDD